MAALFIILLYACYYDYKYLKIPNMLLLAAVISGVVRGGTLWGLEGVIAFCLRSSLVTLACYPLFRIGALGAGDAKLFGICSGYLPTGKILPFLFFSLLISAIFSIVKFCRQQNIRERFTYLWEYLQGVVLGGHWSMYLGGLQDRRAAICLAGPMLCSFLFYWGGVY